MHETLPSAPSVKKGGTPNIAELGRSKRKTDDASGLDSTRFISKKAMSPHSFFGSFDTFPDSKRRMSLDIDHAQILLVWSLSDGIEPRALAEGCTYILAAPVHRGFQVSCTEQSSNPALIHSS